MFLSRIKVPAPFISGSVCVLLLLFYNYSFWQQLAAVAAWPLIVSVAILLASVMYLLLTLVSFKYIYKPILIALFLVAMISAYAMDHYGFIISTQAFQNIIETDTHEVLDLINASLIIAVVFLFILPSAIIAFTKITYSSFKMKAAHIFLACILVVSNLAFFSRSYASLLRNNKQVRYYINPIRPLYSLVKTTFIRIEAEIGHEFVELDPAPIRTLVPGKPKLVVLVVGESDRAMNQSLNGYKVNTNPLLSQRSNLYSFSKFYSCGTETAVSVPCMFSAFNRADFSYNKGRYTENVLDLLQKSNIDVLWRDNDSGCKHVCDRIKTDDFNQAKITPYCNTDECHDEVLLHNLQSHIDSNNNDKLIVLHKLGNHGPAYYKRYPQQFNKFLPTCDTNELQNCNDEQILNTYNNIILYTDFFLDQVIQQLENNNNKYQTALIYVSDHGESLGEKGIYLHGVPYLLAPKEQIHVPFFLWVSDDFDIDRTRLAAVQHQEFSHDNLFHSLLGLFNVKSSAYIQQLDMFAAS